MNPANSQVVTKTFKPDEFLAFSHQFGQDHENPDMTGDEIFEKWSPFWVDLLEIPDDKSNDALGYVFLFKDDSSAILCGGCGAIMSLEKQHLQETKDFINGKISDRIRGFVHLSPLEKPISISEANHVH